MLNKKPSMAPLVVALVEDDRLLREETAKHLIAQKGSTEKGQFNLLCTLEFIPDAHANSSTS